MLTDEKREQRLSYIGASECAAVLGLSRWKTPLSVWAEKTGQAIHADEETLAQWLGSELEDVVARRFMKETGKKVHRANATIFHPKYEFIAANLDRRVIGEDAILECKIASAWKSKEWQGEEIPTEYILQCYHELAVTGKKVCYLAVLIGNQEFHMKKIERDEKLMADIIKREVHFWNDYVLTDIMPTTITSRDGDTLDLLFPAAVQGSVVELSDDANILIENLQAFKEDRKHLDDLIDKTENELKSQVKENEVGLTSHYRVAWINSQTSRLDGKALKQEAPDVHAKFYRTIPMRRFSYKKLEEENSHGNT